MKKKHKKLRKSANLSQKDCATCSRLLAHSVCQQFPIDGEKLSISRFSGFLTQIRSCGLPAVTLQLLTAGSISPDGMMGMGSRMAQNDRVDLAMMMVSKGGEKGQEKKSKKKGREV